MQCPVALTEKVVAVLEARHDPDLLKLNGCGEAVTELEAHPRISAELHQLGLIRQHRVDPSRVAALVDDRHDQRRGLYVQDCREPVKELPPGLPLVRTEAQLVLQARLGRALHRDLQLADVPRPGVNGRPDQLALIDLAAPAVPHRRVAVEQLERVPRDHPVAAASPIRKNSIK